jgi:hypothetical protein
MTKDNLWSILLGFLIGAILNTMPFADGEKYRRAIKECEKTLPRNQNCKVIGVPDL